MPGTFTDAACRLGTSRYASLPWIIVLASLFRCRTATAVPGSACLSHGVTSPVPQLPEMVGWPVKRHRQTLQRLSIVTAQPEVPDRAGGCPCFVCQISGSHGEFAHAGYDCRCSREWSAAHDASPGPSHPNRSNPTAHGWATLTRMRTLDHVAG